MWYRKVIWGKRRGSNTWYETHLPSRNTCSCSCRIFMSTMADWNDRKEWVCREKASWWEGIDKLTLITLYNTRVLCAYVIMQVLYLQYSHAFSINKLLLSVLSVISGNITSSLPGIVYECIARVNNAIGNEQDVSMVLRSKRIRNLSYIDLQYHWRINLAT